MTEYKCKVYLIEPQIGWHGFSLVAAIDANYANQIIQKAAGEQILLGLFACARV